MGGEKSVKTSPCANEILFRSYRHRHYGKIPLEGGQAIECQEEFPPIMPAHLVAATSP